MPLFLGKIERLHGPTALLQRATVQPVPGVLRFGDLCYNAENMLVIFRRRGRIYRRDAFGKLPLPPEFSRRFPFRFTRNLPSSPFLSPFWFAVIKSGSRTSARRDSGFRRAKNETLPRRDRLKISRLKVNDELRSRVRRRLGPARRSVTNRKEEDESRGKFSPARRRNSLAAT